MATMKWHRKFSGQIHICNVDLRDSGANPAVREFELVLCPGRTHQISHQESAKGGSTSFMLTVS